MEIRLHCELKEKDYSLTYPSKAEIDAMDEKKFKNKMFELNQNTPSLE